MPSHVTEQLIFRPASEKPTPDMDDKDVLVYNPCDGWHEGTIRVSEEDGEIYHIGIYKFFMEEMTPHSFYVAWALLPDGISLGEKFESERNPYWHPGLDD
ncbi:hypothetical protein [Pantoea sp. BAV 3049]|uniref:hypothetical protein n=1 Tax=Pantoea sp. BAV 3049 TaxID=2654188 RepID=UPI00131C2C9E|nr:hypothetical protein [Pantoea sp. BAV 3049]